MPCDQHPCFHCHSGCYVRGRRKLKYNQSGICSVLLRLSYVESSITSLFDYMTYSDHVSVHIAQFQSTVQTPTPTPTSLEVARCGSPLPSTGLTQEDRNAPRKLRRKDKTKKKGKPPQLRGRGRHEGRPGEKQRLFLGHGAQLLGLPPSSPFPSLPLPGFPLQRLTLCVFLSRGWNPPPHVCGGEGFQNRLTASRIRKEAPDRERFFPLPISIQNLAHRTVYWAFPWGQFLKACSRVLRNHHQHLAVGWFPVHFRYLPVRKWLVVSW